MTLLAYKLVFILEKISDIVNTCLKINDKNCEYGGIP